LPRDNLVGTLTGVLCVLQMNEEKLKKMQNAVRIGGKGTPRRKKKVVHATAATDDKKLQSSLKKLSVRGHPSCPNTPSVPFLSSPHPIGFVIVRESNFAGVFSAIFSLGSSAQVFLLLFSELFFRS